MDEKNLKGNMTGENSAPSSESELEFKDVNFRIILNSYYLDSNNFKIIINSMIKYFLEPEISWKKLIDYSIFCDLVSHKFQVHKNTHFLNLTNCNQYHQIYKFKLNPTRNLYDVIFDKETYKINENLKIKDYSPEQCGDLNMRAIKIICNVPDTDIKDLTDLEIKMAIYSQSSFYLKKINIKDYVEYLYDHDIFYSSDLNVELLCNRIKVASKVKVYWNDILKYYYSAYINELYSDNKLCDFGYNNIKFLESQFNLKFFKFSPDTSDPQNIQEIFVNLNITCIQLLLMSDTVRNYYLGFNILKEEPSKESIIERIKLLNDLGEEKFADTVLKIEWKKYGEDSLILSNEQDTLSENIKKYHPCDVYIYCSEKHYYGFTTPEFDYITKSGKNPWTQKKIPEPIICEISGRIITTVQMDLPECKTLSDMLLDLKNKKVKRTKGYVNKILDLFKNLF